MERQVDFVIHRYFPEWIGGISTLINDHTVDHREEDHDLEVYLCHLLEVAIMEVQLVIYYFFFKDKFLDICPTAELFIGLAVRKTAGNELIDTVIFIVMEGDLTLPSEIVTKYSLREDPSSLLVEGVLEVDKLVDDDSQGPDIIFWVEVFKIYHIVIY